MAATVAATQLGTARSSKRVWIINVEASAGRTHRRLGVRFSIGDRVSCVVAVSHAVSLSSTRSGPPQSADPTEPQDSEAAHLGPTIQRRAARRRPRHSAQLMTVARAIAGLARESDSV